MHTPAKLRSPVIFEEGCAQVWPDEEIREFEQLGDAASGGYDGQLRIPQHHAFTAEEALLIIDGYRKLAESIGWAFVVRGQTRDYYDTASGRLIALPAIMRPQAPVMYMDYLIFTAAYEAAVNPWLRVLNDLGVDTRAGNRIRHPVAVGRTNPLVPAILQHYGFPTDHLDVTTDPIVALWFALHAGESDGHGKIRFRPLRPKRTGRRPKRPRPKDVAAVPAVHVIIQPPFCVEDLHEQFPLVHLTALDTLTRVARRPVCQFGASLPCTKAQASVETYPSHTVSLKVGSVYRWPAAIVKLYFPFESVSRPDVNAGQLFPKDEVLYARLLEVGAPHLAIYV